MNNFLAVIVPIYKIKYEYLRQCIDTLLKQDSDEYKIILVDDGSPDDCGKICDEYEKKYNNVSVIHQKNQGVSSARNTGLEKTEAKWIYFVDPDDWVEENVFGKLINKLKNDYKNSDIVIFDYINNTPNGDIKNELVGVVEGMITGELLQKIKLTPFYKFDYKKETNNYLMEVLWNKVYRKSFLDKYNMRFIKEAKKGQDRLFNADVLNLTQKIGYYHEKIYYYRTYRESITHKYNPKIVELTILEIDELRRLIKKHNLNFEEELNARICTRIYSCLRLCFFHKNNNKQNVKEDISNLISNEPFYSALKNVKFNLLNFKEQIFVFCLKNKMFSLLKILIELMEKGKI